MARHRWKAYILGGDADHMLVDAVNAAQNCMLCMLILLAESMSEVEGGHLQKLRINFQAHMQ